MKKIENIVIIGGGTAGWITALNFLQKTDSTKITVVCAKEIPVIGVGESTTGLFNDLINFKRNIEINEKDFIKNTSSTLKLGILHKDWRVIGESFTSPLGDEFENEIGYPSSSYDYYRIFHVANKLKYEQTESQFMLNDKMPFLNIPQNDIYSQVFNNMSGKIDFKLHHVAYHLDAFKVSQYIKQILLSNPRVTYVEGLVSSATKDDTGCIKSVSTNNGQTINGDLWVDCSGFFRVLIEKQFENKYIDWKDNLLTNKAITYPKPRESKDGFKNYTKASAKKYGWQWEIPLQDRIGRGYAFNSDMISSEQAKLEIEKDLGEEIEIRQEISFTPGRLEKFWIKNVLSAGLSVGFLEPLEATSIHMSILHINHFLSHYYCDYMDFNAEPQQDSYNREFGDCWDDLRDFLVLHYMSQRKDTDFWIEASSEKRRSPRLNFLLDMWKTRMPREVDYKNIFNGNFHYLGNTLWYQILIGMNLLDSEVAKRELSSFNLHDIAQKQYHLRNQFNQYLLNHAYDNDYFYKHEVNNLEQFHKIYY
jgi:hypothetical protein